MKNSKKWNRLFTFAAIATFSFMTLFSPSVTIVTEAAVIEDNASDPCADSIQWRFKTENGKLYRRLYNYTTASWIGEWEYVCDVE